VPNLVEIGRTAAKICRFFDVSSDARVWTTHKGHLVVFVKVQNLVGIDAVVLMVYMFFDFASLA